jgi:lipopolysaccharide transport system ATP-binding protein
VSAIAIRASGLSKQYRIGTKMATYATLREQMTGTFAGAVRRLLRAGRGGEGSDGEQRGAIWAVKDVSFEIRPGEMVGIVGANGAGKTTLLKLLSRITEPTGGRAEIFGRIGSLLEVGTGFHPELTGRENIFLNGAILGMRKTEIDRRFDEIVAFADVERFLDTPVKHYSSGMYMRLAFAVAAHLESEILIVDEVLAVGDAEFQRRGLAKMQEVGKQDRTVLFVSHNMSALRTSCTRGLLLERGQLTDDGEINAVVDKYLAALDQGSFANEVNTGLFVVNKVTVSSPIGPVLKTLEPAIVSVTLTARQVIGDPGLYVGFLSLDSLRLAGLDFKDFQTTAPMQPGERREFRFAVSALPMMPGSYRLEIHVKDMATHTIEMVPQLFPFDIAEVPVYGGRKLDRWFGQVALVAEASSWPAEVTTS